jgi:CPA2 family monovalent cation:H+ antiporter-2
MAEVHRLMPGLGAPTALQLGGADSGANRSLSELNLRGHTGATVLAILRDGEAIVGPAGTERLRGGDVLALAGTRDAIEAAREVLLRKDVRKGMPTS